MERFNALSRNGKIGVGCLALIVLSVVCSLCTTMLTSVGLIDPTPTPTPRPTATFTPEIPPTGTPGPTIAPDDTDAPATGNAEVCEYLKWVGETTIPVGTAIGGLGTAFGEFQNTPALLFDADWRIRVAAGLAMLNLTVEEIRKRDQADIPDEALKLHAQMNQLATTLEGMSTGLTTGLDKMDGDQLASAGAEMAKIPELTSAMTAEIETLSGECSGQ